ncbi:2-dehydro-3-deoxyglucarate aldolase [Escherichia coli]|nr:2-dehydro-3-deoxyglucarate aldolase [Escherichia coli]
MFSRINSKPHWLRNQVQIGCWSALSNPISTEVLGLAGFDWLVLDGEHAPNDISTFIPQLMALKGSASAPVVRVPTNEPVIISVFWISVSITS